MAGIVEQEMTMASPGGLLSSYQICRTSDGTGPVKTSKCQHSYVENDHEMDSCVGLPPGYRIDDASRSERDASRAPSWAALPDTWRDTASSAQRQDAQSDITKPTSQIRITQTPKRRGKNEAAKALTVTHCRGTGWSTAQGSHTLR
jgi:hypothetical protein